MGSWRLSFRDPAAGEEGEGGPVGKDGWVRSDMGVLLASECLTLARRVEDSDFHGRESESRSTGALGR